MNNYQVMPDLSSEEYQELKSDIAARGVMVPIEYDEAGNILDGHHRLKICAELGIKDYPKVIRAGMSEADKRIHARKLNMARRHLTQEQRRGLIREQLAETPEKSDRQIAAGLGVSDKTVGVQRKEMEAIAEIPQCSRQTSDGRTYPAQRKPVTVFNPTPREEKAIQNPAVLEKLATGERTSVMAASKAAYKEDKAQRKAYEAPTELPDTCRLFAADICGQLPEVEDNSIDYIITDPPYPKEYIPLYGELSQLAARTLRPGGSLIVMCGQSYFPEVMAELSKHMQYHWCMAYLTPGGQSPQLWNKRTNTFWKPVLWFTKGEYKGDLIGDVLKSPPNDNDKAHHFWGQSVGGFAEIVEKFTYPGQTILDPFLGGGTTGIVAVSMDRHFIGTDIEQNNIDTTRKRIMEVIADAGSQSRAGGMEG